MFGDVVLGIPHHNFESEMKIVKANAGITEDSQLSPVHLQDLVTRYKQVIYIYIFSYMVIYSIMSDIIYIYIYIL
jgi:pyruvate,orthophosphate dikinase